MSLGCEKEKCDMIKLETNRAMRNDNNNNKNINNNNNTTTNNNTKMVLNVIGDY